MAKDETQTVSIRVRSDKVDRLERLAKATDRPRSWHVEQALDAYLDVQAWQIEQIEKGMAELKAGKGIPHETIKEWASSLGKRKQRKPPK